MPPDGHEDEQPTQRIPRGPGAEPAPGRRRPTSPYWPSGGHQQAGAPGPYLGGHEGYRDPDQTRGIPTQSPGAVTRKMAQDATRPIARRPAPTPPARPASAGDRYAGAGRPPVGTAPPGTRSPRANRAPRRRWPLAVIVLLGLLVIYPLGLFSVAWSHVAKIDALPARSGPADTSGTTFLVVGSDSRAGLDQAQRDRLATGQAPGQRTDTMMLLHVPSGTGPAVLVSVPRDSYVPIPAHGHNKINAAFSLGGPQLLVNTVEGVSGLHIDHYVETGFGGFANIVDALGGVDICVPTAIKDQMANIDVAAGCQRFDGPTALGYARTRYTDPRGDLGRVERQRALLSAIAHGAASAGTLLNPVRAFRTAAAGGSALSVESGASPLALARFLQGMRGVSGAGGVTLTVPVARTDLHTPAGLSVQWDRTQALRLFAAIKDDDTEQVRQMAVEQQQAVKRLTGG